MAGFERVDFWVAVFFVGVIIMLVRYRPSIDGVHSLVELANTKGGIILILWMTSLLFFVTGLRLSYWAVQMQISHPDDKAMAWLNGVFNWISGGAFMGAFGAMIATMKGEAIPPTTTETRTTVVSESETQSKATVVKQDAEAGK